MDKKKKNHSGGPIDQPCRELDDIVEASTEKT